jgi:glyoxylase-like metal-dependent hydrolase (beta-lactamase superfamily II)
MTSTEVFHFNVGAFKCMAVSDGMLTYAPPNFPPPAVFLCANAPRQLLAESLKEQGLDVENWLEWTSTYTCLLVDTGKQRLLVDTGADGLGPKTGKLIPNLKKEGITADDINLVILTHGHPDHLGGVTDQAGKLAFPNAQWVMGKEEWNFWISGEASRQLAEHGRKMLIDIARKNLTPLQEHIRLVKDGDEIVPGIKIIVVPGHTPGQIILDISSKGERLLCLSDLFLHLSHLTHMEWYAATDVLPLKLIESRHKILDILASRQIRVLLFHFPFPGLGYIVRKGSAWDWLPL